MIAKLVGGIRDSSLSARVKYKIFRYLQEQVQNFEDQEFEPRHKLPKAARRLGIGSIIGKGVIAFPCQVGAMIGPIFGKDLPHGKQLEFDHIFELPFEYDEKDFE